MNRRGREGEGEKGLGSAEEALKKKKKRRKRNGSAFWLSPS